MDDYCNNCGSTTNNLAPVNGRVVCTKCLAVDERHARQEASGFTPIPRKRYLPR